MPVRDPINYNSPNAITACLQQRGWAPLKRHGQNFMIDPAARALVSEACRCTNPPAAGGACTVWEVGPGLGALTAALLRQEPAQLRVFEIDQGYMRLLTEWFGEQAGFSIVAGDVVKTLPPLLRAAAGGPVSETPQAIVGNLPYNCAAELLVAVLKTGNLPPCQVYTLQKEVAERVLARPGAAGYSALSVICGVGARIERLADLGPQCFYPAPAVNSSVVRITPPPPTAAAFDLQRFSAFVDGLFAARRKTIANNLKRMTAFSLETLSLAFSAEGVSPTDRAERLPPETIKAIFQRATAGDA